MSLEHSWLAGLRVVNACDHRWVTRRVLAGWTTVDADKVCGRCGARRALTTTERAIILR